MSGFGYLGTMMLVMLISGSCNTLLMKCMVMQKVPTGPLGAARPFDHPYFQSLLMMIGEFLCLLAFYVQRRLAKDKAAVAELDKGAEAPKWVFGVACLLDWAATTLVNMAYLLIPASIVQMTRGAIVIFTCLFSVVFLRRRQYRCHIVGVFMVFVGITLVSLSTLLHKTPAAAEGEVTAGKKLLGILLCLVAQIFQASMIVFEESILSKYQVAPLQVVGYEGSFGIAFGVILLVILNLAHVESTPAAWYQMGHSQPLLACVIFSIFSIAFFNCSGVTVTQQASATARSTIDVSRTIVIWIVELIVGWNTFSILQLVGFAVVASGTMTYNRLVRFQVLEPPEEAEKLTKGEDAAA